MLFDLRSGKRRRVVQVVYGGLAFLFFAGFVMFGIGSEVSGGLGDVFGLGGNGSGTGQAGAQYEEDIERAEQRLAQDPKDPDALLDLARAHYFLGQLELGQADPETGIPEITSEARANLGAAADAWERYLELERNPDAGFAGTMVQAYVLLNNAAGAARAQEVLAEDQPSANSYGNLALYLYSAGDIKEGDAAADRAVAEAEADERREIERQLDRLREQAIQYQKALNQGPEGGATGENPLQNPFGGFGTGGATAP